jgi:hypothetical protein
MTSTHFEHGQPDSDPFWDAAIEAANADTAFRGYAAHLRDVDFRVVCIGAGGYGCNLRVNAGRIERRDVIEPAFTITGPLDEWRRLAAGTIVYAQATNVVHGQLRVAGDALAAAWLTRPLWQFWRVTARMLATESNA